MSLFRASSKGAPRPPAGANARATGGPGFRIGHSFFCESSSIGKPDKTWYTQVIQNEIAPLLREYYFDDPKKVEGMVSALLSID